MAPGPAAGCFCRPYQVRLHLPEAPASEQGAGDVRAQPKAFNWTNIFGPAWHAGLHLCYNEDPLALQDGRCRQHAVASVPAWPLRHLRAGHGHPDERNMEEIEQLKKRNADLLAALQHTRNAALEEAARICELASGRDIGHDGLAAAIRSVNHGLPAAAGPAGLSPDWQLVMDEVERAKRRFPTWPTDPLHAVAVLGEEFGELTKAVLQTVYEPHKVAEGELRAEAVQTAAMALRFLASLESYEFVPCTQHEQSSGSSAPGIRFPKG